MQVMGLASIARLDLGACTLRPPEDGSSKVPVTFVLVAPVVGPSVREWCFGVFFAWWLGGCMPGLVGIVGSLHPCRFICV